MKLPLFIARQSRQPRGLLGRLIGRIMAAETAAENRVAIDLLEPDDRETILDIGCGPGVAVAEIARRNPSCRVIGLDPSSAMLGMARKRCARQLAKGAVEFRRGTVEDMDLPGASVDGVLSVNTVYFWPSLETALGCVFDVLRPGGRLVLGFRPADDPRHAAKYPAPVYRFRTGAEIREALSRTGFVIEREKRAVVRGSEMQWLEALRPPEP